MDNRNRTGVPSVLGRKLRIEYSGSIYHVINLGDLFPWFQRAGEGIRIRNSRRIESHAAARAAAKSVRRCAMDLKNS